MILQFFERFMLSVSLRTMKVLMTAVSHAVRCALCVEHGFYQMSEWMCGPGVTPLFTCVPVSMSNYPIIRLSVMHEDVAVYDLIWRCCSVWLDRDFAAYRATRGHMHSKWKLYAWMKPLCVKDGSWVSFPKCSHMTCVLFVIGTLLGESWERWFS